MQRFLPALLLMTVVLFVCGCGNLGKVSDEAIESICKSSYFLLRAIMDVKSLSTLLQNQEICAWLLPTLHSVLSFVLCGPPTFVFKVQSSYTECSQITRPEDPRYSVNMDSMKQLKAFMCRQRLGDDRGGGDYVSSSDYTVSALCAAISVGKHKLGNGCAWGCGVPTLMWRWSSMLSSNTHTHTYNLTHTSP